MAVGGGTDEWKRLIEDETVLCPICRVIFAEPKTILSWLHTFCKECLEDSIKANITIATAVRCPACRVVATQSHADPINQRLLAMFTEQVEILEAQWNGDEDVFELVRGCKNCDENLPVVSWCVECRVTLCRGCNEIHRMWKEFREHTVLTVEDRPSDFIFKQHSRLSDDRKVMTEQEQNGEVENKENVSTPKQIFGEITASEDNRGNSRKEHIKDATNKSLKNEAIYPSHVAKHVVLPTDSTILNSKGNEGSYRKDKKSGEEGCVQRNCLGKNDCLYSYGWYFGAITRKDAEIILTQPVCTCGSFLVRDHIKNSEDYILSVRDTDEVSHYWIHKSEKGEFYVSLSLTFITVPDLISYYSLAEQVNELCVTLKPSDVVLMQQRYIDRWEIVYRSTIQLGYKVDTHEIHDVWEGVYKDSQVIIKTPKKAYVTLIEFLKEIELLKQLSHQNIVNLLGVCTQENPVCMITEYIDYSNSCATEYGKYGNLLTYLRRKGKVLTHSQVIDMGAQAASAMDYLGGKKCILRNLQANNIAVCLSKSYTCKLANFNLARIVSTNGYVESTKQEKSSIKWTAPESLRSKRFTLKSDVWSFGVVLYELITRGSDPYPYPGYHEHKTLLEKLETGYRMPCPVGPLKLYKIMKMCWKEDAYQRPTFDTLQQELTTL